MADKSIKQIANEYKKSVNTVQGAITKKYLKARKNSKGQWMIKDEDARDYFATPDIHKWIPFHVIIKQLHVSRDFLNWLREEENLRVRKWKGCLYAFIDDWNPYLSKEVEVDHVVNPLEKSITMTIKNPRGIDLGPAYVICELCKKYKSSTTLEIEFRSKHWKYCERSGLVNLLNLHVFCGEKIKVITHGIYSKQVIAEFKKEVFDNFGMTR